VPRADASTVRVAKGSMVKEKVGFPRPDTTPSKAAEQDGRAQPNHSHEPPPTSTGHRPHSLPSRPLTLSFSYPNNSRSPVFRIPTQQWWPSSMWTRGKRRSGGRRRMRRGSGRRRRRRSRWRSRGSPANPRRITHPIAG